MSFLTLPTELRLQIYGLIVVPVDAPFSAYVGLYLSCHQVKAEIDTEAPKVLDLCLSDIKKSALGMNITASANNLFPATHLHLLAVDPSKSSYAACDLDVLLSTQIFGMYTTSLRFSFDVPSTYAARARGPAWRFMKNAQLLHAFRHNERYVNAQQLILELHSTENWLVDVDQARLEGKIHDLRTGQGHWSGKSRPQLSHRRRWPYFVGLEA